MTKAIFKTRYAITKSCFSFFILHHPLSQGGFANHPTRSANSCGEIRTLHAYSTQTILKILCTQQDKQTESHVGLWAQGALGGCAQKRRWDERFGALESSRDKVPLQAGGRGVKTKTPLEPLFNDQSNL